MKQQDRDKLRNMDNDSIEYINWHEEGGAEVHRINDLYILFEVPIYGGKPYFIISSYIVDDILDKAYSLT